MSRTKSILFDIDRADDANRKAWADEAWKENDKYTFLLPKKNFVLKNKSREWQAYWKSSLGKAIRELGVKSVCINGRELFLTQEDANAVAARRIELCDKSAQEIIESTARYRDAPERRFVLLPIAPDPEPTEEDIRKHCGHDRTIGKTEHWMAEIAWKSALLAEDPDAFLVGFQDHIRAFPEGITSYWEYLQSPLWKRIRRKCLTQAGHSCAGCGRRATLVHHRDYRPRVLQGNDISPLVPLCETCHEKIHKTAEGIPRHWQGCEKELERLVNR
jgi:hypothetical protein